MYAANPPAPYSLEQKALVRRLAEAAAPHSTEIHQLTCGPLLQFPDLQLLQMDSGKPIRTVWNRTMLQKSRVKSTLKYFPELCIH